MSNSGPGVPIVNKPQEGPRVLTYTRTYRIETDLTDEQIIEYARLSTSRLQEIDDLNDALNRITFLHERFGDDPDDSVKVEVHNTQVDEKDPGFF